jgi:hypothetical protein
MPEQSKRGRAQDRAKVAGGQDHEVRYESEKTGASRDEVRQAVKSAGNARTKVEQQLAGSERKGPKKAGQQG